MLDMLGQLCVSMFGQLCFCINDGPTLGQSFFANGGPSIIANIGPTINCFICWLAKPFYKYWPNHYCLCHPDNNNFATLVFYEYSQNIVSEHEHINHCIDAHLLMFWPTQSFQWGLPMCANIKPIIVFHMLANIKPTCFSNVGTIIPIIDFVYLLAKPFCQLNYWSNNFANIGSTSVSRLQPCQCHLGRDNIL